MPTTAPKASKKRPEASFSFFLSAFALNSLFFNAKAQRRRHAKEEQKTRHLSEKWGQKNFKALIFLTPFF
jgi:hypothetical protein